MRFILLCYLKHNIPLLTAKMKGKLINTSTQKAVVLLLQALALYMLSRLVFIFYYKNDFGFLSIKKLSAVFGWGLRMDFVIILLSNLVFLLLYFFLYVYCQKKWLKVFLIACFLACNSLCLALNILDTGYFHFISRRSTIDLLYVFDDSLQSLPGIFSSYWPLFIFFVLVCFLLYKTVASFFKQQPARQTKINWAGLPFNFVLLFLSYQCFTVPVNRMISVNSPLVSMEAKLLPFAQNSPFTFLYSVLRRQSQLEYKYYMPDEKAAAIFPVIQKVPDTVKLRKKNVVIFILESFSRRYLTPGSGFKAHTPFFDSIISHSVYFNNIFSQERSSNKGLMSILGSLPPFTDEPFYQSYYTSSFKKGIGHIFKENGYSTNFFYGTEYDHFGFRKAMNMLGVENYYCRDSYDDKKLYDGSLGLYDGPWLQYMGGQLNKIDTPFLAIEFNVSSHWPYKLPGDFLKNNAVPGQLLSQQSITYVDQSFAKMFEKIKTAPWYNNTVFLFCADHWFLERDDMEENIIGSYEIPMFIYEPSNPQGQQLNTLGGQTDLLPTLYNILGFKNEFTSFGKNLFDASAPRYAFNHLYQNGVLQVLNNDFVLGFDKNNDASIYLYEYKKDSMQRNDLLNNVMYKPVKDTLETRIKALIQQFNKAVLDDKLTPKR